MNPRSSAALLLFVSTLLAACPTADDDDDSTPLIEPPAGCSNLALSGVTFRFFLRFAGTDYPQDALEDLLVANGGGTLGLPIEGEVTQLEADPDDPDTTLLTITELPPEDPPEDWEPNWLQIETELPDGYALPATLGETMGVHFQMDLTTPQLALGFALLDAVDDGGGVRFLAEPSNVKFVYPVGPTHPFFTTVEGVDRACPNLTEFQCAKLYNLAMRFQVRPAEPDGPLGDAFELWPTETNQFALGESSYEVVNVYSYTHREISDGCTGYDWAAERLSYFVIRE